MAADIVQLPRPDWQPALDLAFEVFMQFEAPDYPPQGVTSFRHSMSDPDYLRLLDAMWGAYVDQRLVGMLATRSNGCHIALLFIDGAYHRRGLGQALMELAIARSPGPRLTVNSSPFALEFYHRLGFVDDCQEQMQDGVRYTPMTYTK